MKNRMRPIHPGEILREEYLSPLAMSANQLAKALHVPANRVSGIVAGKRAVTADLILINKLDGLVGRLTPTNRR
jgi:addiction module HigA family antidote